MLSRTGRIAVVASALALGLSIAVAQQETGPFTARQAAQGRADYSADCASCHRGELSGGGEVPSIADGIAFVGDYDRTFKAVDVKNGKTLWETQLGTTVQGYPVPFSVDGKQYSAVTTGLGGGSPENMPNVILTEVHRPDNGQALYAFALPDRLPDGNYRVQLEGGAKREDHSEPENGIIRSTGEGEP